MQHSSAITPLRPAATEPEARERSARPDGGGTGRDGTSTRARGGRFSAVARITLKAVLPLALIGAGLLAYSYLKSTAPPTPAQRPAELAFPVQTIAAEPGPLRPRLTIYGSTVAGRQVEMRSLVAGQVVATGPGLRDGGEVRAGEELIRIDPFDYQIAQKEVEAQLVEARARLAEMEASLRVERANMTFQREQAALAETDLGRAEPLSKQGTVSERTVDDRRVVLLQRRQAATQSENTVRVWEARIGQQRAVIDRLETSRERAAQRLSETRLLAPFNAYVTEVGAQTGRMLGVNDRVATLIDRDWIEVRFVLTDQQFGRLVASGERLVGREVDVRWNVGTKSLAYRARVERVAARIVSDAGGVEVFARMIDPNEPVPLRPGAFVEAELDDTRFENVVSVPSPAVYDRARVYVVADGRMRARPVEVVGADGANLLVRGSIEPGERIIVTRVSTPGDGVRVLER